MNDKKNEMDIAVTIRLRDGDGFLRAFADVRLELPGGQLTASGFSVIEKDGKPPFVGFPSKQGKIPGKYFPVVEAEGDLRKDICDAILEAYEAETAA